MFTGHRARHSRSPSKKPAPPRLEAVKFGIALLVQPHADVETDLFESLTTLTAEMKLKRLGQLGR